VREEAWAKCLGKGKDVTVVREADDWYAEEAVPGIWGSIDVAANSCDDAGACTDLLHGC
jgi:hypothetical protein